MEIVNSKFTNCGGIYKITNIINGKCYIGRTKCFYRRSSQYRSGYKKKDIRYINQYMLNSMEKYGFENFVFKIIELCDVEFMEERENFWMTYFDSHNKEFGYNLRKDSDGVMETHPDTSKKISERLKKEWESGIRSEHSEKLKQSWETRDREAQGRLFTEIKTKYEYRVSDIDTEQILLYKGLVELKLHGVLGKFAKHKTDLVEFKGFTIERVLVNDS